MIIMGKLSSPATGRMRGVCHPSGGVSALRLVRFAGVDRSDDQFVQPHDLLCIAGRVQVQPAQAVDMAVAAAH